MTETSLIKKNSFYSLLSMSSRLIANVIVFWLIARIYGPDQFGTFTFAHTSATLLILLADFGFDILLTTEISRSRDQALKIFQNIFSYKISFSIVAFLIMWAFSFVGNYSEETKIFLQIFSFFLIFTTLTNFSLALTKGFERFSYESIVQILSNVSLIIIVITFSSLKFSVLIIALSFVFARLLGLIISIHLNKKLLPNLTLKIRFPKEKELNQKILVFGFHLLFTNLFFQIDTILLYLWKGNSSVGIYQAVFKFIVLPLMIPDILNITLLPVLSRLFVYDKQKALKISHFMNKLLFFLSLPITLILFVHAEAIIRIIYGSTQYNASIPVLKIFAFNIFIRFSFESFALILTTTNRQIIRMFTVIVATVLNLSLNYLLIPSYGVSGAAIVSLISIVFVYSVYAVYSLNLVKKWYLNTTNIFMILLTVAIAYILVLTSINIFYSIPLILVSFTLTGILFYFTKEDKKILFSMDFSFIRLLIKG